MAGFLPRRTQGAHTSGETRDFILKNSITFTLGDQVYLNAGYLDLGTTERPVGVLDGFVDSFGLPLIARHAVAHGGTYSGNPGVYGSETLVASSTNQTVAKIRGRVIIDNKAEYINTANGALAQSNIGQFFSSTGSDTINAASASATVLVWVLTDIDPDSDGSTTKGIFKIAQHAWTQ